jgi:hypothetical protein
MGIAAVANGLFMLVSPGGWYGAVPGVTTTGPFNQHFVRDIGLIYLFAGISYLAGAAERRYRIALWAVPTTWIAAHAVFHLWEVAVGISPHSAMARDFAAVTLPAIIGLLLTACAVGESKEVKSRRSNEEDPAADDDSDDRRRLVDRPFQPARVAASRAAR